jgi:ubiquinone/menaquinone biosynthesis C-methylase UbiE
MQIENKDHYSLNRAGEYDQHHKKSLRARLTSERELALLKQSLKIAGVPETVLDLPCGTGRFWPAIAEAGVKRLIAGDYSEGMLAVAQRNRLSDSFPEQLIRTSVFDIDLPDNSVDFIACMRFFHHLYHRPDRLSALAELQRVARGHVAVSLWVDGNLASWRRRGRKPAAPERGYGKRVCIDSDDIEADFATAGFTIRERMDVWPRISMWRMYLLEQR